LAGALVHRDTLLIRRPDWQLWQVEGQDVNRSALEAAAAGLADRYLKGSGQPVRTLLAKGYALGNLSGMVSEMRIQQDPPMTTWQVMDWFQPGGKYAARGTIASGSPLQQVDAPQHAMGLPGAAQPAVPLIPGAGQP